MTSKYVFDTYAIIEILRGNKSYERYAEADIIINNFIFAELAYNLFKINELNADEYLNKYSRYLAPVQPIWIKESMIFRLKWKDRKVSMADCIGYIMAKKLGIKFLTGDKEFMDMENVEFVK